MNCREARELLPWLAAGTLPPEEMGGLLAHLAGCPACRAELAQEVRLSQEVRAAMESLPGAPKGTWERVLARTRGIPIGKLELGSFLVGLSFGLSLRGGRLPLSGELEVLGRKVPLFEIEGGAR
ncbi:hypothetical protein DRJ54_04370 [Candidatus Acetothermia bacterium]|nr:MAG: hypothetical protein DRJ54_04370 [Candidatus Acetothermia bacterium]